MGLVFTYAMTYGGAVTSLFRPFVGLLIYVCFAVIRPEWLWHWSVPAGNYSRIVAVALLIGWGVNGFGDWRLGRAGPVVFALIGYWVWACLSLTQATDLDQAALWVETQLKVVLPVVVGATLIRSVGELKQLAWVLVLSHGYVAYDLNRSYYEGFNRLAEVGFGGMDNNSYCIAFCASTGLAFFLGLAADRWWLKALAFGSAVLMVNAVFFAFSRGGILGLMITGVMSFFLVPKKAGHYLTFALGVLLALRLAGPEVVARFVTVFSSAEVRDTSAQSRLDMWGICVEQMALHPILGLGPHQFPVYARSFGLTHGKEAHSLWLQIGAELGVPGLLFLAAFYGLCVVRLWQYVRGRRGADDPWLVDAGRMVIAAVIGFAVSAQFVSLPGLETPYYVVLIGVGVLKLASRVVAPPADSFALSTAPPRATVPHRGLA